LIRDAVTDDKPGYVGLPDVVADHTATGPSFIYAACRHAAGAVYPPAMGEQPLNAGILDLATHKACGTECHHPAR